MLLQLDVWTEPSNVNATVDVHVKAADVENVKAMLKENSIASTIMISDLEFALDVEDISNQKNAFYSGYDYSKYHQYSEVSPKHTWKLYHIFLKYRKYEELCCNRIALTLSFVLFLKIFYFSPR